MTPIIILWLDFWIAVYAPRRNAQVLFFDHMHKETIKNMKKNIRGKS